MAEERKFEREDLTEEPEEFQVEELNDEDLEDVAGGSNSGCTINNAIGC